MFDLQAYLQQGHFYSVSKIFAAVADDGVGELLVRVPSNTTLYVNIFGASTAQFQGFLFEAPTNSDDGTTQAVIATNRSDGKTSGVLAFHTPTITGTGTALGEVVAPGGTKNQSIGSSGGGNVEWVLDGGKDYLVRITNNSGGAADISIGLGFYTFKDPSP